ncbi:hypothetical protein DNL40_16105, partial [Xylanimonas oleitrophica]
FFRQTPTYCALRTLDDMGFPLVNPSGPSAVPAGERCGENAAVEITPADCEEGMYTLNPLWVQRLQDDGTYGPAEQVTERQCITPADLAAEAQRAFTTMQITPPPATVQGSRPLLVNVHYPVYTTAEPLTQTTTLLDVPVEVRAVPHQYTWDFDDPHSATGSRLTTTDPGMPWAPGDPEPDHTWIAHAYTSLGTGTAVSQTGNKYRQGVTVTLTTTWHGQFRIAGTPTWTTIPGQITTTSTTAPFTVTEART